ncbi:hypothetical protein [Streptococcus ferus]
MDKKQIHKIGKIVNKPVKFVKQNAGKIITGIGAIASVVALYNNKEK